MFTHMCMNVSIYCDIIYPIYDMIYFKYIYIYLKWRKSDSVGAVTCPLCCLDYPESTVCFNVLIILIIIIVLSSDSIAHPGVSCSRTVTMGKRASVWAI